MTQLKKRAPFKFDIVGSFLRPEYLKEAREGWKRGTVTDEELRKTEDPARHRVDCKTKGSGASRNNRWRIPQELVASGFYVGS